VTNGVPSSFFQTDHLVPHDIVAIKPPIVGFVGTIADWLDFELLRSLASNYGDLSFLFIGRISSTNTTLATVKALKALKNVFFLEQKRHDELPGYINQFNVGLITFKVNALTQSVNPVKLFEYLAVRVPAVSSPLDEVRELHLSDNVHFLGLLTEEELAFMYKNCDAFVWTGDDQSWGLAPLEAMLFGKPIIISAGNGVSEVLDESVAMVVPLRDPKQFNMH